MKQQILVVGAGFAGATVARTLAEAGHSIVVIDKRDHIAGNAFDYENQHGIRVHKYGPHLWHTSNDEVQEWASQFTEWLPYAHRVSAHLKDNVHTPLPINRQTIEDVFGHEFVNWAWAHNFIEPGAPTRFIEGAHTAFLETQVEHHAEVTNSRQHVENSVGKRLCDLFFAPYTKKMWGLELEDLPASVAARIPTNVASGSYEYFPKDKYQFVPKHGYTEMIRNILQHKNIKVRLQTSREELVNPQLQVYWQKEISIDNQAFDHTFTSEPIDVAFDCRFGELPWRSIKMHTFDIPLCDVLPAAVVNFTDDGKFTRVTEWKKLPGHGTNPQYSTLTFEEPLDYRANDMERYYPVKTSQSDCPNRALYKRYENLASQNEKMTFIGRCGLYVYIDMHMAISSSLHAAKRFLAKT